MSKKRTPLIARITRDTAKLCITVEDVCGTECRAWSCCEERCPTLRITRAGCPTTNHCPPQPVCWDTCTGEARYYHQDTVHEPEPEYPTIEYPMFELDFETGMACFFLDCLFLDQKIGRYDAQIFYCDEPKGEFQIDLREAPRVTRVKAVQGVCHG